MTTSSSFRVLIATDGSPSAKAALTTAAGFPWPAATALAHPGWRVRSLVRDGAPLYELLRVVTEVGADLLVVGIRGRSALAMSTLGSVTEGALTRCRAPVLVVP